MVVVVGDTVSEPEVGRLPLPPGETVTEVAFPAPQVSVTVWPAEMVEGEAVNCMVTAVGDDG